MYQMRSNCYEHQPLGVAPQALMPNQANTMGQRNAMMREMHSMCHEMNNRLSMMQNTLDQVHQCACGCGRRRR
jgi:hypothetical protein